MSPDGFIKLGFWSQLVILVLVDWGTLVAFQNEAPPWYHIVGFVAVNAVLLGLTWLMWRWLRDRTTHEIEARRADSGSP